jgi:hypothetical protein
MNATMNLADVEFEIIAREETESPEGCFATGDDEADRELVEDIRDQLACGNEWAWCCVEVKATFGEFSGSAFLGAWSGSRMDFVACYYEGMRAEAIDALNREIAACLANIPTEAIRAELSRRNPR